METAKDKLIFALDVPDKKAARHWTETLGPHVGMFKVGLELFTAEGPHLVREVVRAKNQVFLDLKLHDIPKTVERAMRVISRMGVKFATVHTAGDADMLAAAVEGAQGKVGVIGVTVLTSVGKSSGGNTGKMADTVVDLATKANKAGCAGIVCSGQEVARVREHLGPDLIVICPGVRYVGEAVGDQKRVVTPSGAIESGADYIVVGRPIRDAKDPVLAAKKIIGEMEGTRK